MRAQLHGGRVVVHWTKGSDRERRTRSLASLSMGFPRNAAAAAACLLAIAAAGCGRAGSDSSPKSAVRPAPVTSALAPANEQASVRSTARRGVREVADPQEANSFPAPASVKHASAATPRRAGELAVAAGAPSDAEVREELRQMQAVERATKQAQQHQMTAVPGGRSVAGSGAIAIPAGVPEVVQKVVAGANEIADFPYVFGGGHASFVDNAYDCSGSVSYALAAGGLLGAPETSGELESWGAPGPGRYITVYANAGHTYMYVDGVLYDTAGRSGTFASRWQVGAVDNSGFVARHWPGL
jgi:cell wall-associated NlpC family hydrolase